MRRPAPLIAFLLLAFAALLARAQGAIVTTEQVRAELVAHAPEGIEPGQPAWLGLVIRHQPHWHTYWKNPGDSGLPTMLQWELPAGVEAGEIQWPTPRGLPVGPLRNYGYEGELLLPVALKVPAGFSADTLDVKLHANWLVCKEVCIPEQGEFRLRVPARAATAANAALFDAAFAAAPKPAPGAKASGKVQGDKLLVEVAGLPAALQGKKVDFLAEEPGVIDHAAQVGQRWAGDLLQLEVAVSPQRSESPAAMHAVLTVDGQSAGTEIAYDVQGGWPAQGAGPPAAEATQPVVAATAGAADTGALGPGYRPDGVDIDALLVTLLFAFVGGALLNLMPCVFPILSLKVLGFAAHGADRRQLAAGGIAYTAGVVASFLALAALLLALRAGGEQLGWGFQLQSPVFVAGLALLFGVIGLNLAGLFEFGTMLPGNLASLRARHPMADHALTGVLAVAVASPCTAPFMGAALGAALTQPAFLALSIFAALGLGMAAPYLAASLAPAIARRLPRPGAWMARFKAAMAFPMFATVVWLLWVLGQQAGNDAVTAMLGVLVAVAFAAWAFGAAGFGAVARRGFGAAALAVLVATVVWAWPALHGSAAAATGSTPNAAAARWQPWSPEAVAAARAEGRPVFVDFTAAWCVTCQYNKRTTLANEAVLADFDARRVLLLRADWTRRDAAITAELARLKRSGVPVYALYPAGGDAPPQLLSEILGVDEVRGALARLAR